MNFKKGIIYVFGANLLNLIISLFSGFVLPKYLSIETYSEIKLFQLYITYIGILHLGFSDGMYLYHGGKNLKNINFKEVLDEFKTFKLFQIIISIIAIIISIIIGNKILLLCSLVILPINIGNYLRNLYSSIGEFEKYSKFTNVNTLLIFFINILLLLIIKSDNSNIYIISYIVCYFVYWLILEIENKKIFGKLKTKASKQYLKRDIKSGFFLMIGNFCNVIFTSIDRLFVKNLLGLIKFAFYSFAVSIQNLIEVFISPISTIMYNYLCNNKEKDNILRIKYCIIIFSSLLISLFFPAKFFINLWIPKYKESLNILLILFSVQYISVIIRCIHLNLYKANKKQKRYFFIMIFIVILSIILNLLLYYFNKNMLSIALATLLTNIIWFIIGEIEFKKYRFKYFDYIIFIIILLSFLLCGIINNAIIGFGVYIFTLFIIIVIFFRKYLLFILNESKNFILENILNRKKE